MSTDARVNNQGYLEIKHPETNAWTPAITLLRIAGGFDVKLIPTQELVLRTLADKIEVLGDLAEAIDNLTGSFEAISQQIPTIANRVNQLISENVFFKRIDIVAEEETAIVIPDGTNSLTFLAITDPIEESPNLRYAFKPGQFTTSNGEWKTLLSGHEYQKSNLYFTGMSLYLFCKENVTIEIECYY